MRFRANDPSKPTAISEALTLASSAEPPSTIGLATDPRYVADDPEDATVSGG
jgi:hypothetical protein